MGEYVEVAIRHPARFVRGCHAHKRESIEKYEEVADEN